MSPMNLKWRIFACSVALGVAIVASGGKARANLYVDCVDATTGSSVDYVSTTTEAFTLDVYAVVIDPSGSFNSADAFNALYASFQTTSSTLKGDVSLVSVNTGGSPNYLFTRTTVTKTGQPFTAANGTTAFGGTSPTDTSTTGAARWFEVQTNLSNFYTQSSAPAAAEATYVSSTGLALSSSAGAAGCEFLIGQIKVNFAPYQSSWGTLSSPTTTALAITAKSTGSVYAWATSAAPSGQAAAGSGASSTGEIVGQGLAGGFNLALQPMTFAFPQPAPTPYTLSAAATRHTLIVGGSTSVTVTLADTGGTANGNLSYSGLSAASAAPGSIFGSATSGNLSYGNSASNIGLGFSSTAAGAFSLTPTASVSAAGGTVLSGTTADSVTVLNHSNPALSVGGGNNQTVIVGAGGVTAGFVLSNAGTNLSPLDVNSLSAGLSGSSGTAVVASGGTASYSAALNAGTIGLGQSQSFSLNAGDQQALPGANALSPFSRTVTLNVLGHSNAALSLAGGNNQTVIVNASGVTAGLALSNAGTNIAPLDVNSLSAGLSGSSGTAVVASGGTASYSAALSTGVIGLGQSQSFSLNAGDQQALLGSGSMSTYSRTVTLNVLGHSNAALNLLSGNNQTVIVGAGSITAGLSLSNAGVNIAPLDVNSLSAGLSGASGTAAVASGGTASYTAALATGTVGLSQFQLFSLNAGDQQALPGANSLNHLSQVVTLNVLGHANAALNIAGGNNQTVIVGAGGVTAALSLSNSGSNLSPLDVNTLSAGLSGSSGTAVVASGGTASYSAALNAGAIGLGQSQSFSLKAGDQQALPGANPLSLLSRTVTLNVLGHSNAALSLAGGNNQTVIVGAAGVTAGLSLSNAGTNLSPLDVNSLSAGLSGASGTAVVASGGTAAYAAALGTGTIGLGQSQSFSLNAGDQQALLGAGALSPYSQTVTLSVLDHAAATAAVTGGNGFLGHAGGTASATILLSNSAGVRSDLQVSAMPAISGGSVSGGPGTPYYLSPGGSQSYSATFSVGSTAGSFSDAVTFAQVGDRQSLLGAAPLHSLSTAIVTGSVFSGSAIWTGTTDNSWNTNANFNDLNAAGVHAAPGLFAGFNDSLVLNDSAANRTLNLNGATPYLSSLTVGTSSGSGYALGQGTGGSLVMNNGANSAAINVTAGQQTISAPVSLASPLNINFSGAAGLVLSGNLSEASPGQGLTISGGGRLTLGGTSSYTGGTTVSQGTLNVTGAMLGGGNIVLASNAVLSGSGVVLGNVSGAVSSTINASGNLSLGDSTSFTGFNQAGTLVVGPNRVTLKSAGFANLGSLTTIGGGTLSAPNGISLGVGCNLSGSGTVLAAVAAGNSSTINATGNLALGDSAAYDGFVSAGRLYTNANTVTLNTSNAAGNQNAVALGSLTQINGGGLVAPNGILLGNGYNLVTNDSGGTVSGGTASRFLNRGNVQGPSSASSNYLIFNMLFKGSTGQSSGRIGFLGGYATGDSPGVNTQDGVTLLGGSGTEFDIGGTTPGNSPNNYGQLNIAANPSDPADQGNLTLLPGTSLKVVDWNGFVPGAGETFTVLTWTGTLSGSASLAIDPAFAAEGVRLTPVWNANSLVLDVNSGHAEWAVANGSWATASNWKDSVSGGATLPPGLSGVVTDTATFGAAVSQGTAGVALNGVAPELSNIIFNNPNTSYTILQGTGTTGLTLTGTGGSSPAAITVISGSHRITAPISLLSNLDVSSSGSLELAGNLSDGGLGKSLTVDGGELTLSGTGSYRGGTFVNSGTLILDNAQAIQDDTSLVVGAGAASLFAPALAEPSVASLTGVTAVPEPSVIWLLAVAAIAWLSFRQETRAAMLGKLKGAACPK
jgi:fibronectin-binding autotransporter adhesin